VPPLAASAGKFEIGCGDIFKAEGGLEDGKKDKIQLNDEGWL